MADKPAADPLGAWRDLVSQWEKNVNALANQTMASDEFSSSMNGAMGLTLKMQETMRDVMSAYLANLNLPSRSDVAALGERLAGIEGRLDGITTLLERIAHSGAVAVEAAPRTPRPPRTKRPPTEPPA